MKYIYGVINSNGQNHFDLNGSSVYAVSFQGLSAVVGDSEKTELNLMPKQALAEYFLNHQQVIEKVMESSSIIPMRLGTYAADEAEVRRILGKGFSLIKDMLGQVADKIEIDTTATWSNFEQLLKEIGREPAINEFKQNLRADPKGVTIDDQLKIGLMVKKALEEKRKAISARLQADLMSISRDCRLHEVMDDKMVINCALLIEKAKREYFDKKIEELDSEFAGKLNFRCVGPLPPYSFYTLEVSELKLAEIAWAKKRLKLPNDRISKDQVKEAYKGSAKCSHPDRKPGAEKEFEDLNKAYKLLLDYAQAGNDTLLVKARAL